VTTTTVLIVDWPSRRVPEAFVRAGYEVFVKGGPGTYTRWRLREGDVINETVTGAPAHADLLYVYRPIDELPGLVDVARRAGATTVCGQFSEASPQARRIVEAAGLTYFDEAELLDRLPGMRR
jgi:predicted CoA-binding protein